MRVALDWGPLLDPPTGIGRYTRELASALEMQDVEIIRYATALGGTVPKGDDIRRRRVPARLIQASWRRFDRPHLERLVGDVDCVHATNFVLPSLGSTPGIVTIHDLSFESDEAFPGAGRLRELVAWSAQRASGVIAPSRSVAAEIKGRYDLDDDRVFVIPEGVTEHLFGATPLGDAALTQMRITRPFVLTLGTMAPRKNIERLVEAWRLLDLEGWTLVVAGSHGWGARIEPTERVTLTGRIEEETLPGLLAAAEIFCYPSLYEGFGLPPLEAMAAGTAVVAGAYPAAAEVLGDAALLVNPLDAGAIAAGISKLATDEGARRSLEVAGKARAASFTWASAAQATIRAYRVVIGG